jgi:predicted thioesterase
LAAREHGGHITVLSLAAEERVSSGCCDTRSVLWNQVCRDFAREYLARAAQVVGTHANVEFGVLGTRPGRAVEGLEREASARGADEIVLADPRSCGLGWFERRRLRRVA